MVIMMTAAPGVEDVGGSASPMASWRYERLIKRH
jgi:hypothetical protein